MKVIFFTFLIGFAAAHYGLDGVRNRYFILGHGRPVVGSVGLGIYGPSLYRNYHLAASPYRSSLPEHVTSAYSVASRPSVYLPNVGHRYYVLGRPITDVVGPSTYGSHGTVYKPAVVAHYQVPVVNHGHYGSENYYNPLRYGNHKDLARPTPYHFGYNVHNGHGDQLTRQESNDGHGNVKGSYGYIDSYGIFRHVDYIADHAGFRANVKTNEPGTAPQDPADVHLEVKHANHEY